MARSGFELASFGFGVGRSGAGVANSSFGFTRSGSHAAGSGVGMTGLGVGMAGSGSGVGMVGSGSPEGTKTNHQMLANCKVLQDGRICFLPPCPKSPRGTLPSQKTKHTRTRYCRGQNPRTDIVCVLSLSRHPADVFLQRGR